MKNSGKNFCAPPQTEMVPYAYVEYNQSNKQW